MRFHQKIHWERFQSGLCFYCGERPWIPGPRGGKGWCDECRSKHLGRTKSYAERNPKKLTDATRKRIEERKAAGLCISCKRPTQGTVKCIKCMGDGSKWNETDRNRVAEIYGNACGRCGHRDTRILQLHHNKFNGNMERREVASMGKQYTAHLRREIIENGPRIDVELICPNCHAVIHWEERERKKAERLASAH